MFSGVTGQISYLDPVNGAKSEYKGGNPPGKEGCVRASYSTDTLFLKPQSPGLYVCVLTNEGRYSEVRVYTDEDGESVRLTFITWE